MRPRPKRGLVNMRLLRWGHADVALQCLKVRATLRGLGGGLRREAEPRQFELQGHCGGRSRKPDKSHSGECKQRAFHDDFPLPNL